MKKSKGKKKSPISEPEKSDENNYNKINILELQNQREEKNEYMEGGKNEKDMKKKEHDKDFINRIVRKQFRVLQISPCQVVMDAFKEMCCLHRCSKRSRSRTIQ